MAGLSPQLTLYRSADPDHIESFWADHVKARVSFARAVSTPAEFRFRSASLGPVTVGRHVPHLDFHIRDEDEDFYLFATARTGQTGYQQRDTRHVTRPGWGVAYAPGTGPPEVWSAGGSELRWLRVESWALERHLEDLLGRPVPGPIQLAPMVNLRRGPGHAWAPLFDFLVDQVAVGTSVVTHPLVAGPLYESVLTGMLLSIPNPYQDLLSRPGRPAAPRSVNQAVAAIESHPERPYTAAALARLAGVGVRTLQQGFRATVGMSPMTYLREVRLRRAHAELLDDAEATVAQVATRWGFTHLGRFAAAYAARYGSPPSRSRRAG